LAIDGIYTFHLYTPYNTVTVLLHIQQRTKKNMNWELRLVSLYCSEYLYYYSYIRPNL
jgi:hypothetical protein